MKEEERERVREVRSRDVVCRSVVRGSKRREDMVVECGVRGGSMREGGVDKVGVRDQRWMRPRESAVKRIKDSSVPSSFDGMVSGVSSVGIWE